MLAQQSKGKSIKRQSYCEVNGSYKKDLWMDSQKLILNCT